MFKMMQSVYQALLLSIGFLTISCTFDGQNWKVKVGDKKESVLNAIGEGEVISDDEHHYKPENIEVTFNSANNVEAITFWGYVGCESVTFYQKPIVFGLKIADGIKSWERKLGKPISISRGASHSELTWYKGSLRIIASYWNQDSEWPKCSSKFTGGSIRVVDLRKSL